MTERSLTPNITVTIGHHTRIYFAFVTTAPTELDSPATVTLHAATFSDVVSFAAEPITLDHARAQAPLAWSSSMRWSSPGNERSPRSQHPLLSADPGLVGLNTLQHWLWQRLQAPTSNQVAA